MARRYVRDKGGRFASKGGGSRGKGGKMGKSAKNVKARAAYKSQSGKLREAKKMAKAPGNNTKFEKTYWNRQLGGAKSGMTRVTNRLTKKRAAAAPTKKAAPKRRGATLKQVATHKRMSKGALKTPKGKMSKAKLNSAKYEYKGASRADRMQGITATKARKRVIKKQTGKTAYEQKMGTEVAPTRLGRTKAPRAGSKTKSQKIRAKINKKKSVNKELRGSEFKGAKKRQSKGEKAVANRRKPARVTARKREEQGLALAGRKAYRKGPGAAERKAAVTGKTMKSTAGRKAKAAYKAKTPDYKRATARDKKYGNPFGSQELGGGIRKDRRAGHSAKRGVKKTRGRKTYDNTTNSSIKMKTKKRDLRRKYPQSKAAKSLEKRVAAKAKKPSYKKPKAGETAKQYKARLKRSGTISTQRALSGNFGTRKEYYSVPGSKSGGKKTRKSVNRAKNRDFYSEGSNKRSKAITKSKQRQREKVKKQKAWEKKNKGRKS